MKRQRLPSPRQAGEQELQRYFEQVELDDEVVEGLEDYISSDIEPVDADDDE